MLTQISMFGRSPISKSTVGADCPILPGRAVTVSKPMNECFDDALCLVLVAPADMQPAGKDGGFEKLLIAVATCFEITWRFASTWLSSLR